MIDVRRAAEIHVGRGGYLAYGDVDVPGWVKVRVKPNGGGRLVIVELHVRSKRITSTTLRRLPVGRIEATVNLPHNVALIQRQSLPHPPRPNELEWWPRKRWKLPEVDLTVDLQPPKNKPVPDTFYKQVAAIYAELAALSSRPTADLADAVGIPATRAAGWVKEARRRGFLPPGQRGRRG
jgi:hypothetical protein